MVPRRSTRSYHLFPYTTLFRPAASALWEVECGNDAGGQRQRHRDYAVEGRVGVREEEDVGAEAGLAHDQRRGLGVHHAALLQHEDLEVVESGRLVGGEVQAGAEEMDAEEEDIFAGGGELAGESLGSCEGPAAARSLVLGPVLFRVGGPPQGV